MSLLAPIGFLETYFKLYE